MDGYGHRVAMAAYNVSNTPSWCTVNVDVPVLFPFHSIPTASCVVYHDFICPIKNEPQKLQAVKRRPSWMLRQSIRK